MPVVIISKQCYKDGIQITSIAAVDGRTWWQLIERVIANQPLVVKTNRTACINEIQLVLLLAKRDLSTAEGMLD